MQPVQKSLNFPINTLTEIEKIDFARRNPKQMLPYAIDLLASI